METRVFNQTLKVVEGWYWVVRSKKVKRGKAVAAKVMGRELVVFRTGAGRPVVSDAHCPHMGAHLSLGKVEGDCLRCFFHNWSFDADGNCVEVPSKGAPPRGVRIQTWRAEERNGVIWVWTGNGEPNFAIPEPPELAGKTYDFAIGRSFQHNCHPNVVMINAIDEQHFLTVHRVPGHLMRMDSETVSDCQIRFANSAAVPSTNAFFRIVSRFYKGPLFYQLDYWYGSNGTVSMGPDFLHLYIMFALRQTEEGATEGQTIVFTKRRNGIFGWLMNRIVLLVTRIAGNYFSVGDSKVFSSIRFDYQTPVPADRAVQVFIRHLEEQTLAPDWPEAADRAEPGSPPIRISNPETTHVRV